MGLWLERAEFALAELVSGKHPPIVAAINIDCMLYITAIGVSIVFAQNKGNSLSNKNLLFV